MAAKRRHRLARPTVAQIHVNLGEVLQRQGQFDAAAEAYRGALKLNREFPEAQRQLDIVLKMKQQR